jgi:hypothetical protein
LIVSEATENFLQKQSSQGILWEEGDDCPTSSLYPVGQAAALFFLTAL